MNKPMENTVAKRLDGLERELRWWKVLGSAAVAVLAAVLFMGAAGGKVSNEVQAERFVVVDKNGKTRVELGLNGKGVAGLRVSDEQSEQRISLSVGPRGGEPALILNGTKPEEFVMVTAFDVSLWNKNGYSDLDGSELSFHDKKKAQNSAYLSLRDGEISLSFNNSAGGGTTLTTRSDGMSRLTLWDTYGGGVALDVAPDDTTMLGLFDKRRQRRAVLALHPDGSPAFELNDQQGTRRAVVGLKADGSPLLGLTDKAGKTRTLTAEADDASRPTLYWVLWAQEVAVSKPVIIALGAWPTRSECEAQRIQREKNSSSGGRAVIVFACLPDTVNLRERR